MRRLAQLALLLLLTATAALASPPSSAPSLDLRDYLARATLVFAAQNNVSGPAIQFRNAGTPIGSPYAVNCSTNITCTFLNGVVTMTATGGGGGGGCTSPGTQYRLLTDDGVGGCSEVGALGTTTTLLHGNAAGLPTFGAVVSADLNITGTTCTNQVVSAISSAAAGTCHTVVSADTTGTFAATAHNLLSTTHGDTTASAAVRGGGIFAIGASPLWTQVAHSSATGGYFKWNGTDIVASTGAAGGTGACTNGIQVADNADAAPTCTSADTTTTHALFATAGTPAFRALAAGDVPNLACSTITNGVCNNASNTYSTGTQDFTGATNALVTTQSTSDNSTKAASTAYVTTGIANAIAAVNPAVATQAATTAASDTSGLTYNNGASGIGAFFTGSVNTAIVIDGYTFTALGQRLLVKNDTQSPSGAFNGVYYVTQIQTAILPPILTRALDYDMPSDINNTGVVPVVNGTVNADTGWLLTSSVTTVGTDPLTYTQFSLNPTKILTAASALATGKLVQAAGNDRTTSDSGITAANVVVASSPGAGVAHFAGSTQTETSSAVVSADMNITTTSCTNQVVSAISSGGVGTCHTVVSGDTSGTFSATAHNFLSATHGDTTAGTVARGDLVTGQGSSATWTRLAKGSASNCLQMDASAVDIVWAACPAGGTPTFPITVAGTVTSGGIPCFDSTTNEKTSVALTVNVYVKGGGAGACPGTSLTTDDGTTSTYTGTGGTKSPVFTATGTTAGFYDLPQGTTSSAVAPCNAATSICHQAPTAVTSYLVTEPGAAPAINNSLKFTSTAGVEAYTGTLQPTQNPQGIYNFNTAAQSQVVVSATEYYITKSDLDMPAAYTTAIGAGTTFTWHVAQSKTAAGTGTYQILFKHGTNGSTADTTDATITIGTQTAALDDLFFDLVITFTSATAYYYSLIPHQFAGTGTGFGLVFPAAAAQFTGTVSSLTTTTASDKYGLSFKSTTGTPTIVTNQVQAHAYGVN